MAAATLLQHQVQQKVQQKAHLKSGRNPASREELAALIATHSTTLPGRTTKLSMVPGQVIGLEGDMGAGLTRLALVMLAKIAERAPVAIVDTRGWFCPVAAWEVGIPPARLSVIRCTDAAQWPAVLGALLTGLGGIYAEVPSGIPDQVLRRLGAKARQERAAVALRPLNGRLPAGIAHMRLAAETVSWSGPDQGHGRLAGRSISVFASGKGVRGMETRFGVEDDGTSALHLVGNLGVVSAGRAVG